MAENLFRSGTEPYAASEAGDERPPYAPTAAGKAGLVREDKNAAGHLKGVKLPIHDPRKYRYDVVRGRGGGLPFSVTRDDRMSVEDASEMLHNIHLKCGVATETEAILQAFDNGLWFCHTVNGGSTLVPGRSTFSVPGVTGTFDYGVIRDLLSVNMRRFFRTFADDIADTNKRVIRDYDPSNPVAVEQYGWLMSTAHSRGIMRYPWLAHDSADACLKLSPTERQALQSSKALVVGYTPNSADRMRPLNAVESADRFDSSVGESL